MFKKRYSFSGVLSFLLIIGLVLPNSTSFAQTNESNLLDLETVEETITNFVSSKKQTFEITDDKIDLRLVSELYGLDDNVIAYYFNVIKDQNIIGYVLASGDKRIEAIIEYGLIENNYDDYYGELLKNNNQQKAYYLGVEEIEFSNSAKKLKNHLKIEKSKVSNDLESKNNYKLAEQINNLEVGLNYNIENQKNYDQNIQTIGIQSVGPVTLPVNRVYQRLSGVANPNSSCGPAAGAMIANYYKQNRGFNVRDSFYYGGNAKIINHLYFDMNSSIWGTNAYSFGRGLQLHLNHSMTGWRIISSSAPSYGSMVSAINSKYPVGAVWLVLSGENYHWRVLNGYDSDGGQYVSYKDSDGGSTNTGNRWVSWSSIYNKINTVYLSR